MTDGGPAFPIPSVWYVDGKTPKECNSGNPGMSLRDWFAGQALAGLTSDPGLGIIRASRMAYDCADEMMKERERAEDLKILSK
jgi:hypothetical protein